VSWFQNLFDARCKIAAWKIKTPIMGHVVFLDRLAYPAWDSGSVGQTLICRPTLGPNYFAGSFSAASSMAIKEVPPWRRIGYFQRGEPLEHELFASVVNTAGFQVPLFLLAQKQIAHHEARRAELMPRQFRSIRPGALVTFRGSQCEVHYI